MNTKYRFDQYDSAYEYNHTQNAYVFIGKLNGRTEEEFINDYERSCWMSAFYFED